MPRLSCLPASKEENSERQNERKFIQLTLKWKYDVSSAGYGLELYFFITLNLTSQKTLKITFFFSTLTLNKAFYFLKRNLLFIKTLGGKIFVFIKKTFLKFNFYSYRILGLERRDLRTHTRYIFQVELAC